MTQKLKFEQLEHFGFGPKIMQKTRLCPWCSCLVTNGENTCTQCGRALPNLTLLAWYQQQHATCTRCGTVLSRDSIYCPHCGKRIKKMEKWTDRDTAAENGRRWLSTVSAERDNQTGG